MKNFRKYFIHAEETKKAYAKLDGLGSFDPSDVDNGYLIEYGLSELLGYKAVLVLADSDEQIVLTLPHYLWKFGDYGNIPIIIVFTKNVNTINLDDDTFNSIMAHELGHVISGTLGYDNPLDNDGNYNIVDRDGMLVCADYDKYDINDNEYNPALINDELYKLVNKNANRLFTQCGIDTTLDLTTVIGELIQTLNREFLADYVCVKKFGLGNQLCNFLENVQYDWSIFKDVFDDENVINNIIINTNWNLELRVDHIKKLMGTI